MANEKKDPKNIETMFIELDLDRLQMNEGQLEGLPSNPRNITDTKLELLKKDIQQYPEMLKLRGLMVYPMEDDQYLIIGGNMRYFAMKDLGFKTAPCIVIPKETSVEQLKAYTVLDNSGFGKWDWDMLANDWEADDLTSWGLDLPIVESEINTDDFFDAVDNAEQKEKGEHITVALPEGSDPDLKAEIKQIIEDALSEYDGIKVK